MNETDQYILDAIRTWVWSGFYTPDEADEIIDDILEDDADEDFLRSAIEAEFEKKSVAEATWPEQTDCDRLDAAFNALNELGIIALQNSGYTMSDGLADVSEVLQQRNKEDIKGYCFYHGQDLERVISGDKLLIAFGTFDDDTSKKVGVGNIVKKHLESNGFIIEWNNDPETRLNILNIDWKRRFAYQSIKLIAGMEKLKS